MGFRASSVQSCYLDSHLVRELLPEAKEHREEAWAAQVKKAKDELNEMEKAKDKDKDKEKKISALRKRIESLEGACTSLMDGESSITRVQDGSTRVYLRKNDKGAVDLEARDRGGPRSSAPRATRATAQTDR